MDRAGIASPYAGGDVGVAPPGTLKSLSGVEFLRALLDGRLPVPPISALMDFKAVEIENGRVLFSGTPGLQHYNPIGMVHGGYAATLLDSCMGCAVHSSLPAGSGYTTLEIKISYIRSMTADTGEVRAEGIVLNAGRRAAYAEGKLTDGSGKLLAHGTTTCLIFPL